MFVSTFREIISNFIFIVGVVLLFTQVHTPLGYSLAIVLIIIGALTDPHWNLIHKIKVASGKSK